MPCDTIQTSSVELKSPNIKILLDALKNLGYQASHNPQTGRISFSNGMGVSGVFQNGEITVRGSYGTDQIAKEIKIAYSKQIVNFAAKQFGWNIKDVTSTAKAKKGVAATFKAIKR